MEMLKWKKKLQFKRFFSSYQQELIFTFCGEEPQMRSDRFCCTVNILHLSKIADFRCQYEFQENGLHNTKKLHFYWLSKGVNAFQLHFTRRWLLAFSHFSGFNRQFVGCLNCWKKRKRINQGEKIHIVTPHRLINTSWHPQEYMNNRFDFKLKLIKLIYFESNSYYTEPL